MTLIAAFAVILPGSTYILYNADLNGQGKAALSSIILVELGLLQMMALSSPHFCGGIAWPRS